MKSFSYKFGTLFLLFVSFIMLATGAQAENKKVSMAFLPFVINSAEDMSYLQEGLRDMLASRLSSGADIAVIDKVVVNKGLKRQGGKLTAGKLAAFAKDIQADYVMFGSVTVLGEGMSIDGKVYQAADNKTINFFAAAPGKGDVMQAIDTISWDVAEKIFSKKRPVSGRVAAQKVEDKPLFQTDHPDRAYRAGKGEYGHSSLIWAKNKKQFSKTKNVDVALNAMAAGDIDGDGRIDIVMADRQRVYVYHLNKNRLKFMGEIKVTNGKKIHTVNVADLNDDGKGEIYISAADSKIPGSKAVEWNGTEFVTLFDNVRYYIRPVKVPGSGQLLVGQETGLNGRAIGGPLYSLIRNGQTVTREEKLNIPEGIDLFNFSYADLNGDGDMEIVAVDEDNKLMVLETGGKILWQSDEYFVSTGRFVGGEPLLGSSNIDKADEVDGVGVLYERIYIPSRIVVADIDNDGFDDVILNQNPASLTRIVRNLQSFKSGVIRGMKWNGLGLEELWRTKKIDGYVLDYVLQSNQMPVVDGSDRLLVGIAVKAGMLDMFSNYEGTLLMYSLDFEQSDKTKTE